MSIYQFLATDSYVIVNKTLIHQLGLHEAVIFGELCSEYVYWESQDKLTDEGMFFCTIETLEEVTGLSEYKQRRCIRNLEEAGLIKTELRGLPSMRYFKIIEEQVLKFFQLTSEIFSDVDAEKTKASKYIYNQSNRDYNNTSLNNRDSRVNSNNKNKKESIDTAKTEKISLTKAVVDSYNKICVSLPSVRSLTDKRKKAIKALLQKYTLDDFNAVFQNAENSDFLTGNNDRGWQANFDFLLREDKFVKILEGGYDSKKGKSAVKNIERMNKKSEKLTPEQKKKFKEAIANGTAKRM